MSKLGLNRRLSSFRRGKRGLIRDLVNQSARFFQRTNFQHQAFVDRVNRKWKPLKRPRAGLILVKTGRMRRDVTKKVLTGNTGTVTFNAPYSSYHNEGTRKMAKRQFLGESAVLNALNERIILNYIKRKLG